MPSRREPAPAAIRIGGITITWGDAGPSRQAVNLCIFTVILGPAPIDWLTLFTLRLFAAAFIATGRRKLLIR
jgi:hypothetical protein